MEYKNTLYALAAVGGLALYLQYINKKEKFVNPIPLPTVPGAVLNPDAPPPILNPKPGEIEEIWNSKPAPVVKPVKPTYPGSEFADFFTGGTVTNPAPTPAPTTDIGNFNPKNPYDPSGFIPGVYAGGYSGGYAAYG